MKNNTDYGKLYNKFMECKCDDNDDDNCINIYGCKYDDNCKDYSQSDDDKFDHDCKSLWSRKPDKCSNDVFKPVCDNAICNVPRMDMTTMVAEGHGTIDNAETSSEIAFKFFIGKKHNKYVGNMCLVNYETELFLTSDKIECFHSPNHTKFVAIFHFAESENSSREIAVYGTTQICSILPTLYIYSAPHCGDDDEIAMGGSVTTGTITIALKDDTAAEMGH